MLSSFHHHLTLSIARLSVYDLQKIPYLLPFERSSRRQSIDKIATSHSQDYTELYCFADSSPQGLIFWDEQSAEKVEMRMIEG